LWNAATYQPVTTLNGHDGAVLSVAFSPKGNLLATGNGNGNVRLWNAATYQPVTTLNGHDGAVLSVAFSPDSTTLATGSEDGTVRLWDVATHQPAAALTGHTGSVWSVAFSPDGKTLATGSSDDTVRLWDVTVNGLIKHSLTRSPGPVLAQRLCAAADGPSHARSGQNTCQVGYTKGSARERQARQRVASQWVSTVEVRRLRRRAVRGWD